MYKSFICSTQVAIVLHYGQKGLNFGRQLAISITLDKFNNANGLEEKSLEIDSDTSLASDTLFNIGQVRYSDSASLFFKR